VTVASHWLQQYARYLGLSAERILYLPNGYEPDAISPAADSRSGDDPAGAAEDEADSTARLLWYTRFTEADPGRAAALLAPLLVGPQATRLAILGEEINAGDRDALAAALAAAGVADRVDWLGYDPAMLDRLVRRHGRSLVAAYPLDDDRVNRARCPSKISQLMALGIPLVGESVGELACYLAGFESECLAPPSDAAGFQSRVRALLGSAQMRAHLGERLKTAADTWTWEHTAAGLLSWYTRV
jgi:glycosyltransferase involved in cell wall biosynthesis